MAVDVAAIAARGRWFKHTYPGSLSLPERDPPPDNRWQRSACSVTWMAFAGPSPWASLAGSRSRPHRPPDYRLEAASVS